MSTNTSRLGLTKPDGSDPFSRAVLNQNFDLIDASAGPVNVATATALPTNLDVSNKGRLGVAQDTQTVYIYQGPGVSPAWIPAQNASSFWYYASGTTAVAGDVALTPSGSSVTTWERVGSITTKRPGTIFVQAMLQFDAYPAARTSVALYPVVNGTFAHQPTVNRTDPQFLRQYKRKLPFTSANANLNFSDQVVAMGYYTLPSAGSYTFGCHVDVGITINGNANEPDGAKLLGVFISAQLVNMGNN